MVIRRTDSVAAVLRHDESLIDVFIGLSPAFERLRNSAMRKVMSRLVTVEQAARIAGVDGDELVRRLNRDAPPGAPVPPAGGPAPAETSASRGLPPELQGIPRERVVEVDVREDLRAGKEPFSRIMAARREVPEGGVLSVRAIFEPVPLYAVLGRQGYDHVTERLAPDDWRVWFYPARVARDEAVVSAPPAAAPALEEGVVVLDVRNLEPPEPMMRTLAALDELPPGGTLVQLNVRVPQFLLPRLEERGFRYEIREQAPDLVRVFIRRAAADRAQTPMRETIA